MRLENLNKNLWLLGRFSALGYIFFSVVPYAVAGRHICSALMLVAFAGLLFRKQINNLSLSWLSASVYIVIGLALISAVLSPYSSESLNQLRKDGLPFLLGFLLLTNINAPNFNGEKTGIHAVSSLILGYAAKEVLAIWAGAANDFQFSVYETGVLPKYLDFFAADTPYYLPFLLGPLFFWPMRPFLRSLLFLVSTLALVVVVVSGVRTAFIFALMSALLVPLYRFWSFRKLLLITFAVFFIGSYLFKDEITSPTFERYTTIFVAQTYKFGNDGSVSERYAIIKGVWEVSKERLLLGYGPGWKKLPTVAEANGHMNRWRNSSLEIDKVTLNYFSYGEGRVNPHNFYMALLFEGGIAGLIAYLSLMFAVGTNALKMLVKSRHPVEQGIGIAGCLYLMVYFGGSLAGGAWLPVTMLVTVVALIAYQKKPTMLGGRV